MEDTQVQQGGSEHVHDEWETAFGYACLAAYWAGLLPRDEREREYHERFRRAEAQYAEHPPIQVADNRHAADARTRAAAAAARRTSPLTGATLERVAEDIQNAVLAAASGIRAAWPGASAVEYSVNKWAPWMPLSFDSVADALGAVLAWQSEFEEFEDDPEAAQEPGLAELCRLRDAMWQWQAIPGLIRPADATWMVYEVEVRRMPSGAVRSVVRVELPRPDHDDDPALEADHGGCFQPHHGAEGYVDCDGRPV